ncbi:RagB/SusD family nutrient uptake outer membrane protein [Sphingobacterium griseoflavum]|uniref:Membrane protein n=1 Tax=Sphingobacterium griseoflavum TaxID=1474952 RepID=A0ABQ3HVA9_9SPHI|nr:RagB/SusD family nutrient uptake outer membrane protein [Sphingobacterium griseoflavum]GHE28627.1 membrane protein [Sphingobacterium griseoflavum]
MKKKYLYPILWLGFMVLSTQWGCVKLDHSPPDRLAEDALWRDANLMRSYIADLYRRLPIGFAVTTALPIYCDEARGGYFWLGANTTVINGAYTAANAPLNSWDDLYTSIRRANIFLDRVQTASGVTDEIRGNLSGQAHFLRALLYFELAKRYGGVPLITTAQTLAEDLMVRRNTAAEIYDFIRSECLSAAALLPNRGPAGFANRWAAKALEARAMLYAGRWEDAAAPALDIIGNAGYSLATDYASIFHTKRAPSSESIFEIQYLDPTRVHNHDALNVPYGDNPGNYTSWVTPLQEIVDAYEMQSSGLSIHDPNSGYDPQHPYIGRDPRFYATILYEGAPWKGRHIETRVGGRDGIVDRNANQDPTKTGYYLRKYLDESLSLEKLWFSTQSYVEFRLGEIYLIAAEALNEARQSEQAKIYVDVIRQRAQMPAIATGLDQATMRRTIQHERQIELAFENHRYWDLRRWGIAVETLHNKIFTGMRITLDNGIYTYDRVPADWQSSSPRVFLERQTLLPIPLAEIEKNPKLTQNPGW